MTLLLIGSGKLAPTEIAGERLLTRVSPDVSRQVIRSAEGSHADPALERLLTRVDADVASQFIGSGKPAVTSIDGTGIRALVDRSLTGTIGVLARLDRDQLHRSRVVLVHLAQDLVPFAGRLIVLRQAGL